MDAAVLPTPSPADARPVIQPHPQHVAMIMDGNGRWAEARGLSRVAGHARGAKRVSEIVKACPDLGITHLTLFAFSTENWRRPLAEVEGLMRIFRQYIVAKAEGLRAKAERLFGL